MDQGTSQVRPDETERLCTLLSGRETASKWLGGSEAPMLHDAADEIENLRFALVRIAAVCGQQAKHSSTLPTMIQTVARQALAKETTDGREQGPAGRQEEGGGNPDGRHV